MAIDGLLRSYCSTVLGTARVGTKLDSSRKLQEKLTVLWPLRDLVTSQAFPYILLTRLANTLENTVNTTQIR